MRSRPSKHVARLGLLVVLVLTGCTGTDPATLAYLDPANADSCVVDEDGDARGLGCVLGDDCDDLDARVFEGCDRCAQPEEGCTCSEGTAPTDCFTQELVDRDTLLCHVGTRYCQEGRWTACLGVMSFEADAPERSSLLGSAGHALVPDPPSSTACSPCRPACFPVTDPLTPVPGGLDETNSRDVTWLPSGGITNQSTVIGQPQSIDPSAMCPATGDADCDGVPDAVDARSGPDVAYGTVGQAIYMDLAPGESNEAYVDVPFLVRSADVYFLLDTTEAMAPLLPHFAEAIGSGSFLSGAPACPDVDGDGAANGELAMQGIAGNVSCAFRDARVGLGFTREIPFVGPDANGVSYGDADEIPYAHLADLGASAASLSAVASTLTTSATHGGPEGQIQGLWAALSGGESYVGWDRPGIVAREDCAPGTSGYPCFREDALPLVVMLTASPMYNGPSAGLSDLGSDGALTYPLSYPSSIHDGVVNAGTYPHYLPVDATNDTFASAYDTSLESRPGSDVGPITDDLLTFTGDTRGLNADANAALFACSAAASASGADAMFRFEVDTARTVTVSARGSHFPAVVGLVRAGDSGDQPSPLELDFSSPQGRGDVSPNALGQLPAGVAAVVTGDSTLATGQYPRELLGCYEHAVYDGETSADSSDYAADVRFQFTLASDMTLRFEAPEDDFAKSLSLYEAEPQLAHWQSGGVDRGFDLVVADGENIGVPGDLSGNAVRLVAGFEGSGAAAEPVGLSTEGRAGDLSDALFASAGCTASSEYAPDEVVEFSLSRRTTVRIETSGDAQGMAPDFDHLIGLYRRGAASTPVEVEVSGNEAFDSAAVIDESSLDGGGFTRLVGSMATSLGVDAASTSTMSADFSRELTGGDSGCGSANRGGGDDDSPDAVFALTLSSRRTIQIDTAGTSFRTHLSLHQGELVSDDLNDTQATARDLGVINAMHTTVRGDTRAATLGQDYSPYNEDASGGAPARSVACGANAPDAVYRFTLTEPTTVRIDTFGSTWDTVLALYESDGPEGYVTNGTSYEYPASLGCSDDALDANGTPTTQSEIERSLPAGTYYVVVTGWSENTGAYVLHVSDVGNPGPVDAAGNPANLLACDSGSLPSDAERSRIVRTLDPGTYYVVLKGDATQTYPDYGYVLDVYDVANAGPSDALIACGAGDVDVLGSGRAIIEHTLEAGDYAVGIRGTGAADAGRYRMTLADVEFMPPPLACHDHEAGFASSITERLSACEPGYTAPCPGHEKQYWLVMRGYDARDAAAGQGPYRVLIRDVDAAGPIDACDDEALDEITSELSPGTYYAIVKGRTANDAGPYQLTVGDPALTSAASYDDLVSYDDDVRSRLQSGGVRVLGVQYGADAALTQQLETMARDTQSVSPANAPIVVQLDPTSTDLTRDLGEGVMRGIEGLTASVALNVGLRLNPAPSAANPGFQLAVYAIDEAGDGCEAPVQQVHQRCVPGATPRFRVTFSNPATNAVPPNPDDAQGGYWMTLELVGDGRYVLERIPVYLIPSDVTEEPYRVEYASEGEYFQSFGAANCSADEEAEWFSLTWDASLPPGTSLTWSVCSADSAAGAEDCALSELATVTSGGSCASDADCDLGFCQANVCQYAVGPMCTSDTECGEGGQCVDERCRWTGLPIDPRAALRTSAGLGNPYLKVDAKLRATTDRSAAPSVYEWSVRYECVNAD